MSALSHLPQSRDFLQVNNFRFIIKKAPNLTWHLQKVNLPEVELGVIMAGNPMKAYPVPGEHVEFGSLNLEFKVDEDMANYMEIYTWLVQLGFPNKWEEYVEIASKPLISGEGIRSDIVLMVETSANNPKWEITFTDAFPYRLSSYPVFDTTGEDVNYMVGSVDFAYMIYKIRDVNDPRINE